MVDDRWFSILEATRQQPVVDPLLRVNDTPTYRLTEGLFLTFQKNYYQDRPCMPYGRCNGQPALRSSASLVRN